MGAGSLEIRCAKSEGEAEGVVPKGFSLDELLLECKCFIFGINAGTATALTDTIEGSILAEGTSTLGYELGTLNVVVALAIEPVHIECGGNLTVVRGGLIGTETPLTLGNTGTLTFSVSGSDNVLQDYTNDKGEMVSLHLESSLNGGAFELSARKQVASLVFNKNIEIKD